jgi:glutamate carboxypeptidase
MTHSVRCGAPLLLCLLALAPITHARAPSDAEVLAGIRAREHESIELLERVVNVNSGTLNFPGVREVGRIFAARFEVLGFKTRWIDGATFGRAGHLIAGRERADRPRILLIGHLDTVFDRDSPFQRFERIDPEHARGPGVTDMKGGIVVMLAALAALERSGTLDQLDLTVVLHGDEEDAGTPLADARRDLVEAGRRAAVAIGFEDGDGRPETAVVARRGASSWRIEASGRAAHSSQIFTAEVGAGAIYELARILTGFQKQLAGEPYVTFSPGVILGGTQVDFDVVEQSGTAAGKENVVAQHAVAAGDLRTLTPQQLEATRATMRDIVSQHLPQSTAAIEFVDGYPPMAPTAGNRRLLAMYDAASRDLGVGAMTAVDPKDAGAADIAFVAADVDMAIDGVGLMGSGGHTVAETADLTTLSMQAARTALVLARIAR